MLTYVAPGTVLRRRDRGTGEAKVEYYLEDTVPLYTDAAFRSHFGTSRTTLMLSAHQA